VSTNGRGQSSSHSTPPEARDQLESIIAEGQAILRLVAAPSSLGFTTQEIARGLGISKFSACALLDELAEEIERLN